MYRRAEDTLYRVGRVACHFPYAKSAELSQSGRQLLAARQYPEFHTSMAPIVLSRRPSRPCPFVAEITHCFIYEHLASVVVAASSSRPTGLPLLPLLLPGLR